MSTVIVLEFDYKKFPIKLRKWFKSQLFQMMCTNI